ncbi:MAG: sporulation protein YabP [Ruminococcaceae bacterium]|nr:sporulation protein YabP [Oscillospiraceae bacterium]
MESVHKLVLTDRSSLLIEGVNELVSFDESSIELITVKGRLYITGKGLNVGTLCVEKGAIDISGSIDSLEYLPDVPASGGFFKKLFS